MSKRPPNELESRLHQAALGTSKRELTAKQAEAIIPDVHARQNALNFLLGVGLFKSLKDGKGSVSFRAVTKNEIVATKDLNNEENLVLNHIKLSGNEGIWTKHLKTKTNLHQTLIDRCLKTLTQKHLIKRVPSVQHPTRKIYMLENLEPSIALTGGPWYTDNELDSGFIRDLTDACYKIIRDLSFPKRRAGTEGSLYPISNAPEYPTARHIRDSLRRARLTETDLNVEHIEMLLNVLVLDGKIEKIPAFGSLSWKADAFEDDTSPDESQRQNNGKRKKKLDSNYVSGLPSSRKRKKLKAGSDEEESDGIIHLSRRKSKKRKDHQSESDATLSTDDSSQREVKKSKRRKILEDSDHSSVESEPDQHRKRGHRPSRVSPRSLSPFQPIDFADLGAGSGGYAYRAVKEERLSFGWSEAPCSQCPSFEFCKDGGPVNPHDCVYYGEWLVAETVTSTGIEV